jgi:hypothetical protein
MLVITYYCDGYWVAGVFSFEHLVHLGPHILLFIRDFV